MSVNIKVLFVVLFRIYSLTRPTIHCNHYPGAPIIQDIDRDQEGYEAYQPPPPDDPFPAPSSSLSSSAPSSSRTHSHSSSPDTTLSYIDSQEPSSHSYVERHMQRERRTDSDETSDSLRPHQQQSESLQFHPHILEYGSSPVCIPTVSTFTITSTLDEDIELVSIEADNPQFYPVLFQPQTLPPNDSILIRILFLPFYTQPTGATLRISTSIGEFTYKVVGAAAYNSYRLRPFIGFRVASGVPFQHPITIHNPHDEVLHVRDIFTTEEFLSLQGATPSSEEWSGEGSNAWELEPGAERSIIHLSMGASAPGFYSGYVHIKTNKDNIVIPAELTVLEGGLHASPETLDFGAFTSSSEPVTLELTLLNSGSRAVEVVEVVPVSPDPYIKVNIFAEKRIIANGTESTVARVTYHPSRMISGRVSNKLLVVTNHSNPALATLEVPYEASSVYGGIGYELNDTLFTLPVRNVSNLGTKGGGFGVDMKFTSRSQRQKDELGDLRDLVFTNYFSQAVHIHHVSSNSCPDVMFVHPISNTNMSRAPLEKFDPVRVQFNRHVAQEVFKSPGSLPYQCWLDVQTNLSTVRLPLVVIDGGLVATALNEELELRSNVTKSTGKKKSKNGTNVDIYSVKLGGISSRLPRPTEILLTNPNPIRVPVSIKKCSHDVTVCWARAFPFNSTEGTRQPVPYGDDSPGEITVSSRYLHPISQEEHQECEDIPGNTSATLRTSKYSFLLKAEHSVRVWVQFQSLPEETGTAELRFETPYQHKVFYYHFNGLTGRLKNSFQHDQLKMMMGLRTSVNVYTFSTFKDTVNIDSIHSSAPLIPALFHESDPLTIGMNADSSELPAQGFLTAHLVSPYLQCLKPFGRLKVLNMWSCLTVFLDEWLVENVSVGQDILVRARHLQDLLRSVDSMMMVHSLDTVYRQTVDIKEKWNMLFPNGMTLPTFDVIFRTSLARVPLSVEGLTLQMPLWQSSNFHSFVLPPVEHGHAMLVYLSLHNPFDIPLEFKLSDESLPAASFDRSAFAPEESVEVRGRLAKMEAIAPTSRVPPFMPRKEKTFNLDTILGNNGSAAADRDVTKPTTSAVSGVQAKVMDVVRGAMVSTHVLRSFPAGHHAFSRFLADGTMSAPVVLPPHTSGTFGPIVFVPRNNADVTYNMTMYVVNNYTTVDRVDVLVQSGPISLEVMGARVLSVNNPDLEPTRAPSIPDDGVSGQPEEINDSVKMDRTTAEVVLKGRKTIADINPHFSPTISVPPTAPLQMREIVAINTTEKTIMLELFIANTGKMPATVDYVVLNNLINLCTPSQTSSGWFGLMYLRRLLTVSSGTRTEISSCGAFPVTIPPYGGQSINMTLTLDCSVGSDRLRVGFMSAIHKAVLLDVSLNIRLAPELANECTRENFSAKASHHSAGRAIAILLLCGLSIQVYQQYALVFREDEDDASKRPRGTVRSPVKGRSDGGERQLAYRDQLLALDPKAAGHRRGDAFSYLRKGVNLSDILTADDRDGAAANLEAVEALKARRISSYYTTKPDDACRGGEGGSGVVLESHSEVQSTPEVSAASRSAGEMGRVQHSAASEEPTNNSASSKKGMESKQAGKKSGSRSYEQGKGQGSTDTDGRDVRIEPHTVDQETQVPQPHGEVAETTVKRKEKASKKDKTATVSAHEVGLSGEPKASKGKKKSKQHLHSTKEPRDFSTAPSSGKNTTSKVDKSFENKDNDKEVDINSVSVPMPPIGSPPTGKKTEGAVTVATVASNMVPEHDKDNGTVQNIIRSAFEGPSITKAQGGNIDPTQDPILSTDSVKNRSSKVISPHSHTTSTGTIGRSPTLGPPPGLQLSPSLRDSSRLSSHVGVQDDVEGIPSKPDRQRSISHGMENMVAGILDFDSTDNLLAAAMGLDSPPSTQRTQRGPSEYEDEQFSRRYDASEYRWNVPSSGVPPGFAGALGLCEDSSLFSTPSYFSDTRSPTSSGGGGGRPRAESSGVLDSTPPSTLFLSPHTSPARNFTLPVSQCTEEDDWGDMLTMPMEDIMRDKVDSIGMIGSGRGSSGSGHHYSHVVGDGDSMRQQPGGLTASDVYGVCSGGMSFSNCPPHLQAQGYPTSSRPPSFFPGTRDNASGSRDRPEHQHRSVVASDGFYEAGIGMESSTGYSADFSQSAHIPRSNPRPRPQQQKQSKY
eukprot:CAMPEP_0185036516 /NCGR_PEP_ID=MMETSP1103-20130426/29610_1 /TAXON_ID=36769 /ORGANISM="Paraphysomonas bandaiensis, Strain Caron Lab Isolate" /LENGTH=2155 /DNA_ID=CAMNT_0027574075 /DNA_START=29 /DNA_END=6496 /DNA_ORIENTATION=-